MSEEEIDPENLQNFSAFDHSQPYRLPGQFNSPTPEEELANKEMIYFVRQLCDLYDTDESADKRQSVINTIRQLLIEWATDVGKEKGISDEYLVDGGGIQVQIYGSTKLDVQNADSDIDILCIAPSFINKADFFNSFCEKLSQSPNVESFLSIPEAYTPVIKFTLEEQSIDIVFASLQTPCLPVPVDVLDLKCLKGLDEQSVRSLNGVRVAEWLLKLVPNPNEYRIALRIIKFWAKQRGLYSNVLGFLGGVNFAILMVLVNNIYQDSCPVILVQKFFALFSTWRWPTPVMIRRYEDLQFLDSDGRYLPVWNPVVNFKDATHIMPIITPAYPAMNSAYNISQPQFRTIREELLRGHSLFQKYPLVGFPWEILFESSTKFFFTKYPRYIQIDIKALSPADHRSWFGWVESRIRLLIIALEQPPLIYSHPLANCFHRQPQQLNNPAENEPLADDFQTSGNKEIKESLDENDLIVEDNSSDTYFSISNPSIEGNLPTNNEPKNPYATPSKQQPVSVDTSDENKYISSFFIGLSFDKRATRVDLTLQIQEFIQKVSSWKDRKSTMEIQILTFDNQNVPSFVYYTKAEPSNIKSCTPKIPPFKSPLSKIPNHDPTQTSINNLVDQSQSLHINLEEVKEPLVNPSNDNESAENSPIESESADESLPSSVKSTPPVIHYQKPYTFRKERNYSFDTAQLQGFGVLNNKYSQSTLHSYSNNDIITHSNGNFESTRSKSFSHMNNNHGFNNTRHHRQNNQNNTNHYYYNNKHQHQHHPQPNMIPQQHVQQHVQQQFQYHPQVHFQQTPSSQPIQNVTHQQPHQGYSLNSSQRSGGIAMYNTDLSLLNPNFVRRSASEGNEPMGYMSILSQDHFATSSPGNNGSYPTSPSRGNPNVPIQSSNIVYLYSAPSNVHPQYLSMNQKQNSNNIYNLNHNNPINQPMHNMNQPPPPSHNQIPYTSSPEMRPNAHSSDSNESNSNKNDYPTNDYPPLIFGNVTPMKDSFPTSSGAPIPRKSWSSNQDPFEVNNSSEINYSRESTRPNSRSSSNGSHGFVSTSTNGNVNNNNNLQDFNMKRYRNDTLNNNISNNTSNNSREFSRKK